MCSRERKTNAPEYLGTNFFLAAASAAAQGFSQSQTTTVVDGNSVVGAVTGDQGKFILGQAIGGGLKNPPTGLESVLLKTLMLSMYHLDIVSLFISRKRLRSITTPKDVK